jgi:hypothetical protein
MKMMKLGMRSVPMGKTSWETWCLNYQGQRHYLRTMQIIALGPLQYQHWAGPDMRLDISWRYRTDQKRQKSETIPGNTKNEVNVPSQAKTDHDDNSLQGGIDDFVSLSASQTEIMSMIWFWQIYQILSHLHVLRNLDWSVQTKSVIPTMFLLSSQY